jgi:hypothetical protein
MKFVVYLRSVRGDDLKAVIPKAYDVFQAWDAALAGVRDRFPEVPANHWQVYRVESLLK